MPKRIGTPRNDIIATGSPGGFPIVNYAWGCRKKCIHPFVCKKQVDNTLKLVYYKYGQFEGRRNPDG